MSIGINLTPLAAAAAALETVEYDPSTSVVEKRAVSRAERHRIVITHGIVMGLAFAVFFPLGAIIIRLLSFKGLMWIHAGWQVFAYVGITLSHNSLGRSS